VSELRRIPSTHIAAALGFTEWSSPLSVWASCRNGRAWDQNPDAPHAGVRLMPALRNWAAEFLDAKVWAGESYEQHHHIVLKPDGQTDDGRFVFFRTPRDPSKWEEQVDEDEDREPGLVLPTDVMLEAQAYHAFLHPKEIWVGALIAGNLKMRLVEADEKTCAHMGIALHVFWNRYVKQGKEPKATKRDEKLMKALHPEPTLTELKFDALEDGDKEAVLAYAAAQRARTTAEKEEKALKPVVLQAIGEHSGIIDFPVDCQVASVSCDTRDPYPNNGTYRKIADEYLNKLKPASRDRLIKKYTPTEGTKVLRPFFVSKSRLSTVPPLPEPPADAKGAA